MEPIFRGSGVALVTPFTEESVDFEKLEQSIDRQIAEGTNAIVVLGTTGEPSTMRDAEREGVIAAAVERTRDRVPLIVGVGTNDTIETIDRAQTAQALGAHQLLVVTPYYNKATQAGLIKHYEMIADRVTIPIILYNVPARTGLNMLPETVAELAAHARIVGLKEAADDIRQLDRDLRLFGDRLNVYSGNDDTAFAAMALGARGVISVTANVAPGMVRDMAENCLRGDFSSARAIHRRLANLNRLLFIEVNPIPAKAALAMLGLDSGIARLPLTRMTQANRSALARELCALGLLRAETTNT